MTLHQKPTMTNISTSAVLGLTLLWQITWLLSLTLFQLRDKIISWGVVGPNCGECLEQTTASVLLIMIPLFIGATAFSLAATGLLRKKPHFTPLKLFMALMLAGLVTYVSFISYGILNFIINY